MAIAPYTMYEKEEEKFDKTNVGVMVKSKNLQCQAVVLIDATAQGRQKTVYRTPHNIPHLSFLRSIF
jgi:hypothetical protein